MHTHSFEVDLKSTQVQKLNCNNCDFTCKEAESMEVHVGKCCYEKPICGLCDLNFTDSETLDTHLNTCEIYECGNCGERYKLLSEIKEHMSEEQMICKFVWHIKMDRDNKSKVDFKKYFMSEI